MERARLYLCTPIRADLAEFLDAVLGAGVDVVQLRDKEADARALLDISETLRKACERHGALFIVNDRVDLALACGADGVHLGQDDLPPDAARAQMGDDLLIGRSTHSSADLQRAIREPVDYLGVGPVYATPTKPGRPGVGLEYVRQASVHATVPWFVTGGMDATTIPCAVAAGARRFVVVRAITEASDPAATVRVIRAAIRRIRGS